ncbi:peptidyl-prolyl cis-trans isomerase [Youhaiella tibetensis]|uniref:Peptidyl-prolyl cis-trans isomerase n=1 Tax=Paradevosia tibetensis TaxID=1447062 RepID=A0A5B9DMP3_9HYPH|nr:peptidylprolyl isomerase [Youhaiella tibetensis]AKR55527.1 Peptidyl-prolyl cis-trans isomerase [Devosia sp. H5989]QEE20661.1 peptidylprolyl isomerase [Youhaiella tibetensis]GGF22194.1 peptidyl-prolyl cis-trans isomerase [Youhaiella tibetensis]
MSAAAFPRVDRFIGILAFAFVAVIASALGVPQAAQAQQTGTPHLMLQLKDGTVDIELLPNLAPKHVERIVTLTEKGFYDGIVFHRVIDGFMAQTGDPTGTGMGGSDLPDLPAEFSSEPFVRGVIGAARTQDPNSANSQFFIMFADAPHLNGQYTVFGKVVAGMEFVDNIKKGSQADNGAVTDPDKIISAKIEYK